MPKNITQAIKLKCIHIKVYTHRYAHLLVTTQRTTQASDPLVASLPLRLSPPLASVSEASTNTAAINSAFQIVASVLGSDVKTATFLLPEQARFSRGFRGRDTFAKSPPRSHLHHNPLFATHAYQVGAEDDTLPFSMMGDYRLSCLQVAQVSSSATWKGETVTMFVAINRFVVAMLAGCALVRYSRGALVYIWIGISVSVLLIGCFTIRASVLLEFVYYL